MKNKKLLFGEARFVFEELGDSLGSSLDVLVKAVAEKDKRLKRKRETAMKLSAIKLMVVKDSLVLRKLNLGGKVFEVPFDKMNSKSTATALLSEVLPVLEFKANEPLLKKLQSMFKAMDVDMKLEDIKPLVAGAYAETILRKAKWDINLKYSRLSEYAKAMKIKDMGVKAKISSDASGKIKVEFASKDPDLFKKYKKWERENAPKGKAKAKPKEVISKPELDRFAKSPLGKIFGHLMGGKNGDKNWLQLMQEGKAPPLALFIAGLFGYKIGVDMYNGAIDFLPDKFKGRMKTFERKARASKLSAKSFAKKNPRKAPEVGKGAQEVTADLFSDVIKQNSIPSKGLKLGENYSLKKGETLVVDLTGGGQVVLPKGQDKAYVNGKLAEPGKIYKNVKITFSNTIPKGTVITGKVDLKKVIPKKKA